MWSKANKATYTLLVLVGFSSAPVCSSTYKINLRFFKYKNVIKALFDKFANSQK